MDDDVERLIISPFREIVEKGNTAIDNAQNADDEPTAPAMLKAAQALVKEGERALKRIEPLCRKNFDEYGTNFIGAIKDHKEITEFRSELEDLLWDFDEYIEADEFDQEKFEELQKTSRKAAPKIVDILKRMKLVAPDPPSTPLQQIPINTLPPVKTTVQQNDTMRQSGLVSTATSVQADHVDDLAEPKSSGMLAANAGPDEGLEGSHTTDAAANQVLNQVERSSSHRSQDSLDLKEAPPRPPSADPWKVGRPPPLFSGNYPQSSPRQERRPTLEDGGDSPTLPAFPVSPELEEASPFRSPRKLDDAAEWRRREEDHKRRRAASNAAGDGPLSPSAVAVLASTSQGSSRPPSTTSSQFGHASPTIPEDSVVNNHTRKGNTSAPHSIPQRQSSTSTSDSRRDSNRVQAQRHGSTESFHSGTFDSSRAVGATSPVSSTNRTSIMSIPEVTTYSPQSSATKQYQHQPLKPPQSPPPMYQVRSSASIRSVPTATANQSSHTLTQSQSYEPQNSPIYMDDGLIPIESENPSMNNPPLIRQPNYSIGLQQSFYKLGGFCNGAKDVMRGGLGIKQVRRPVGGFSSITVGKCKNCMFELDWRAIDQDLNNDPSGNFQSNGVGFRLRFLSKCHLHTRHIDEQLYGCPFCIQTGETTEESDATVFFNQRQLFAHMARHPRPLPDVPGLTVVEGEEVSPKYQNNFDIHLPNPPTQSVMAGIAQELLRLPTAVATETKKNQNGIMRSPPDRTPVLQFAVGARIVGIEFPAKYEGKWAVGWHDGVRAVFEADSIQLDEPPQGEKRMQGTSTLQAVVRWKWTQKSGDWLRLDKGETVKNIGWYGQEHWCWSGTTSRGWGIFPASHIDPNSVREEGAADRASINSGGESKNLLSRIAISRKLPGRVNSASS